MNTSTEGLSHYCILEAHNSLGFTGSQVEENLPQDEIIPQVWPMIDVDDIEKRLWILDFRVDAGTS